ncbi:hypothetical protein HJC23_004546 [Cyclotella cryptica]|uniref:Uncharacterized protein n=1 Tax=Cyclotella cryptica TaxID=29204 RepID=A0ABD3QB30_9STRA
MDVSKLKQEERYMCHNLMPRCIVVPAILQSSSQDWHRLLCHQSLVVVHSKTQTGLCKDIDQRSVNYDGISDTADQAPFFNGICNS